MLDQYIAIEREERAFALVCDCDPTLEGKYLSWLSVWRRRQWVSFGPLQQLDISARVSDRHAYGRLAAADPRQSACPGSHQSPVYPILAPFLTGRQLPAHVRFWAVVFLSLTAGMGRAADGSNPEPVSVAPLLRKENSEVSSLPL